VADRGLTDVVNVPGEFIPQCGCTVDVIAAELGDILIAGKPLTDGHALIVSIGEEDGSKRVTLNLSAGHRVRVRTNEPVNTLPREFLPYERIGDSSLADSIRLMPGERLLVLQPFGWHIDGSHIPNAAEHFSREGVCKEHGWEVVFDFGPYIAVVRQAEGDRS
jgi:hypothetical protein